MKITVLGSGTCASNLPGVPARYPPGFLVEASSEKILFDCSEGIRFRLEQAGYDPAAIAHIAISHAHADHFVLAPFLQSVYCSRKWTGRPTDTPVNLYVPDQIARDFPGYWNAHLPGVQEKAFPWPKLNFHSLSKGERINIGGAVLEAFPAYHSFGEIEALAFRLELPPESPSLWQREGRGEFGVFAYSGDTGMCEGILNAARNADLFICEASARVGDETQTTGYGHLSPYGAGLIAREAGVKRLVLTHYQGFDSDKLMIEDCGRSGFTGEIAIAKDFQVFEL